MLYDGFRRIFWGFIFIFLEIHIIAIDILPDPVGYYLILSGLNLMKSRYHLNVKANYVATLLVLVSIPTVFLQNNAIDQLGSASLITGWSIYMSVIGVLNLVLAYFIFRVMISIATNRGDDHLLRRTTNTFKAYMIIMLLITFFESFAMNMTRDLLMGYVTISAIFGLTMNIILLVLLSRFSKLDDNDDGSSVKPREHEETPTS
ncbi:hypothetical protein SAMN05192533_11671 [Mesobacillus persicus]|uniref:Uncharacterized protein n=1 Tax=Mesobacillus persicus TaxID=930146 RepID=A0A1H8I6K6_9BACI|nr:hypothetical protein [Mesobacillus persicus]SEN63964.1 hypothetical protein SAMN05192533_11671 [Mesobacillus persicus]